MKGLFLTFALFSFGSLFAQEVSTLEFPPGVESQKATPQQLADAVSRAIKSHPSKAAMVVREAMEALNSSEGKFSEIEKKRAAAIIGAAVASAPEVDPETIVAAGVGITPTLGAVVAQAAKSVPPQNQTSADSSPPAGMLLGNIQVQKVQGKGVKVVGADGKTANLNAGDFVRQGVKIVTGPEGSAVLIFENGSLVQVEPNTEFSIEKFQQDPFSSADVDFSTIEDEPSKSSTRIGVLQGEISFDVAKLKKNSTYEIITPVGVSGIRGTGGFVKSSPNNLNQAASFGLFEGSATFTSSSGQTQVVNQNQSIGISGARGNFGINPNPPGSNASLAKASQGMSQARSETVSKPFVGAPPPQAAPSGPMSSLSPAQQQSLQQAAAEGSAAVEQAALQMATQSPQEASDIAAAASDLAPAIAATLAVSLASALPEEAAAIASSVSSAAPIMAPSIASSVGAAVPAQATAVAAAVTAVAQAQAIQIASSMSLAVSGQTSGIAAAVSNSAPNQASMIAATMAAIAPAQAASIAAAVATAQPTQAASIAASVASTIPAQSTQITAAVVSAVPAQAAAIAASVGGTASSQANSNGATEAALPSYQTLAELTDQANTNEQNPAVLVTGSPTPNSTTNPPSSTPSPTPPTSTPEPTIPPVSPSA